METHIIAVGLLYCTGAILAEQRPYPLQLFYLSPNSVALLPPTPVVRALKEDEALVEGEATQFHSQDSRGRALFGYTTPDQARIEARSEDGSVRGSYSYLDAWGKAVKVQYWDDGTGFHAAGNNLPGLYAQDIPQPVQDTPEVTAAKEQHFQLFQQALAAAVTSGDDTTKLPIKPPVEQDQEGVVVESDDPNNLPEDDVQELTRYPNLQNFPQNLFDPTQVHDANREAVIVDNPDITARTGKNLQESPVAENKPPGGFFYSFRYAVPMYIQVKTVQDWAKTEEEQIDSKNKVSVSQKAALFGAVPVAAVHDAQVPPYLKDSIKNFQVMPLYVET